MVYHLAVRVNQTYKNFLAPRSITIGLTRGSLTVLSPDFQIPLSITAQIDHAVSYRDEGRTF